MMRIEVELWSTAPEALESVRRKLMDLPGDPHYLEEEDGRWFLVGSSFTLFACEHQGYVKRIMETV